LLILKFFSPVKKLSFYPFETQFHKTINLKPSKDAIGPESTDGSHNELNDRLNTEQETKLVKNRNKMSTEHTELKEEVQCLAKEPQNCRLPEFHFAAAFSFC
jgi:hypothetical protein